ncbi:MAG: S-layer homology domain-containing protein [Bacillota bacterium]|nr:S-layer homology domain-containing protein [Bacillota bacterium]
MKKLIGLILMFTVMLTMGCQAALFKDIEGHWAEKSIDALVMAGVINGVDDATFAPESPVTREQFLKMLLIASADNINEKINFENPPKLNTVLEKSPFPDVSIDRWSYYYIKEAYGTLIFSGEYPYGFGPVKDITREEAAVWTSRALGLTGGEPNFTDNDLIKNKNLVGAASGNGLITGFADGSFKPSQGLTRAQAAAILQRVQVLNAKMAVDSMTEGTSTGDFSKDLNGDGTVDTVKVFLKSDGEGYALKVNDCAFIGGLCQTESNNYYLVDVNTKDTYKEIAVVENDNNSAALAIYRYTGSDLYLLGYIQNVGPIDLKTGSSPIADEWGAVSINGDGTVSANIGVQFVHTMLVRKQFTLNAKNRLVDNAKIYYTMGEYSKFIVKNTLESTRSDEGHPAITLNSGYAGKIVSTDLKNWLYIETGNGDSGWIYVENDKLIKGENLSYYLDGLWYAG